MTHTKRSLVLGLGLLTLVSTALAQNFRPGRSPLPPVSLKGEAGGEEAITALAEHLPGVARHHGLTPDHLTKLLRQDHDLRVDRAGRLLFAESHLPDPALAPVPADTGVTQAGLVPVDQTFFLHSQPNATKKIYLDFNGHTTTGTLWVDTKGSSTFVTPPYDFDGNTNSFSTNELERIQYIWQRVAEDYSPFEVDVTTEDPGVEGLRKTTATDVNYGIRVCIGGASQDWYSTNGYGGVSYIGCFDWNSDTPNYVWPKNLGNGNEKYVAEAISHEVGHALDLYHDTTSTVGYYAGHGTGADGWAPIMGVGYYQPVVQFSKGEYLDAQNLEDDLAKITAAYNIPYIPDDYGNDLATAFQLPAGTFFANGLIEQNTDVDVFRFNAAAGTFNISVNVDSRSPNLNLQATLYDAFGTLVAVSNPSNTLGASFNLTGMAAGTYYLAVDGLGAGNPLNTGYSDYGSIGTYAVSGTVPSAGVPIAVASASPSIGLAPLVAQLSSAGSLDPDGGVLTFSWSLGDGTTSTAANPLTTYTLPGVYSAVLTVTDVAGLSASATVQITVQAARPTAPASLLATAASSTRVNLSWQDLASNETGFKIERSTNGVTFSQIATAAANVTSYADTTVTAGKTYTYRVCAYNAAGNSAYSLLASATTPAVPPAAPTSLTARANVANQISLTWRDNASNETGCYVERSLNRTTWTRIATLAANAISYTSTGLTANTTYYHRVQAYGASGVSAYSNVASIKTKR